MSPDKTTYKKIHDRIEGAIRDLYQTDLDSTAVPLVVMAHSLGGHMMSNYIWDTQKGPATGVSSFENLETLSGIVTFGCNIPLFTFAHENIVPVTFPPDSLSEDEKQRAQWLNFYDPDDILGYPLKKINDAYGKVVDEDIKINAGGSVTSWNPASHSKYWTDKDFIKPVSELIIQLM